MADESSPEDTASEYETVKLKIATRIETREYI